MQEDAQEVVAGPTMLEEMRGMEAARHHSVPGELTTVMMQLTFLGAAEGQRNQLSGNTTMARDQVRQEGGEDADAVRGDNSEQWSELPELDDDENDILDVVEVVDENTVSDEDNEDDPMVIVDPFEFDRAAGRDVEDEDAEEEAREWEQELSEQDGEAAESDGEEEGDPAEQWPEPPAIDAEHDGYLYWDE